MTGFECRGSFLSWLALEKRASPLTVEAYGTDLTSFLGFLTQHQGAEADQASLALVTQAEIRAWLASLANEGLVNASRARHLSAVRS
ncbi:MAG TPA: site-specific integrase, partial [Acetobacteraceae bacterium]|nr:site-specific integrase [Acetobacteraceae bacterium]